MSNKSTAFERVQDDIRRGDTPRPDDIAELERRAAETHNHYPNKIDKLHADLKEVKTRLSATQIALDDRTAAIVQAVTMERNDAGKPVFSNESLRSIEIKKRMSADPKCAQEMAEIEELQSQFDFFNVLLERAKNDYAAWKDMFKLELAVRAN